MASVSDEQRDEDSGGGLSLFSFAKQFALPIVATAASYILHEDSYVCSTVGREIGKCYPEWMAVGGITFLLMCAYQWTEVTLRLGSPKVQWNGGSTTYDPSSAVMAGDYLIVRAGGVLNGVFRWKGNRGLIVLPNTAANFLGMNLSITAELSSVGFDDLPDEVQERIADPGGGLPRKGPYLFGLVDSSKYIDDDGNPIYIEPSEEAKGTKLLPGELNRIAPKEFERFLKSAHRQLSYYKKVANEALNTVERLRGQMARINAQDSFWKGMGEGLRDRIRNKGSKEKEE